MHVQLVTLKSNFFMDLRVALHGTVCDTKLDVHILKWMRDTDKTITNLFAVDGINFLPITFGAYIGRKLILDPIQSSGQFYLVDAGATSIFEEPGLAQ